MAKFEIEFELTGLKLKIRGERDDIPNISQNIGQQVAGLFSPAAKIVEGGVSPGVPNQARLVEAVRPVERVKRGKKKTAAAEGGDTSPRIAWTHDPNKWGTARQGWKAREKIIYLMYVVTQETQAKELTAPQIVQAFNDQFRQAGPLDPKNMSRDLGGLKDRLLVGETVGDALSVWFLTEAGIKEAQRLVGLAKSPDLLTPEPGGAS